MTLMTPPTNTAMTIQVSGRHVDVGDALRARIAEQLAASVGKFFERSGGSAEVVVSKDRYGFCVDVAMRLASGQQIVASGAGADAHLAFDVALEKAVSRVKRYKTRLKDHHAQQAVRLETEATAYLVLRAPAEDETLDEDWAADGPDGDRAGSPAIIAETEALLKTMTVSMAVMDLDLTDAPAVMFRNAAHGGLSVVYRRADGNIGWIDPERTRMGAAPRSGVLDGKAPPITAGA